MKKRLDEVMVQQGLAQSRSQAARLIKLGKVEVDTEIVSKPGQTTSSQSKIAIAGDETYVSRAGFKLASVAERFGLEFKDKTVLDVGSSTGGFTDYALQNGAKKVIAVDVGTDQLHLSLRGDERIELHEKTDIRELKNLSAAPDIVLIDVSFISLREVLPAVATLASKKTQIVAMVKPQFEAGTELKHKGVIKNEKIRRQILKDFETWAKQNFVILDKADSDVTGEKGNRERFYLLGLTK